MNSPGSNNAFDDGINPYEAPLEQDAVSPSGHSPTVGQVLTGIVFGTISGLLGFFSTCLGTGYVSAVLMGPMSEGILIAMLLALVVGVTCGGYVFIRVFRRFTGPPNANSSVPEGTQDKKKSP